MSTKAFSFVFSAADMQRLLDTKPTKVVCVVSIEEATTTSGKKVGALNIVASGPIDPQKTSGLEIDGCPVPPCVEN